MLWRSWFATGDQEADKMERLFIECAVRAALLVGSTAAALYVMRIRASATQHRVWTVVVLLMLGLPFWTAWGPKMSLRLLPSLAQATTKATFMPTKAFSNLYVPSPLFSTWSAILLTGYLLGLCWFLFRLAIGTVHARRLVRDAIILDGVRTSASCAAPVTVGFFSPSVILPERWSGWSQAQLDAVLTHEGEHARRCDPLVQWLALLNRALFWFHPVAWWLERHLSSLAEDACDNVVLARGHSPRQYAEYLLDAARSVARSGSRLNVAGMAMPGSFLQRRIQKIMQGGQAPHVSRLRLACLVLVCAIMCSAVAAGKLDHARQDASAHPLTVSDASASHPATKFVLGDLKIEGDIHDRAGIRERIVTAWKDREYDEVKELQSEVMEAGIRADFQKRGYFKVAVHDPVSRPLGLGDGKQRILLTTSVTEGDQFRLGTLSIQDVSPDHPLSIPVTTLREQFHLRNEDLFSVSEIRDGLNRMRELYAAQGYPDFTAEPDTEIDSASHHGNLILRVTEGPHKP
jgi:beta-lactamase regulating signal transducer with metallopeptidase domain